MRPSLPLTGLLLPSTALTLTIPSIFTWPIAWPIDQQPWDTIRRPSTLPPTITPSTPSAHSPPTSDTKDSPLPVILWHGLGDSADADGLASIADLINSIHPGTYVHTISLASDGSSSSSDRSASFFGNLTTQLSTVCSNLASDNILRTAPAVDALGFSQGGQFLRAYIERCGHWAPKVRSLITFGSQHNGIAEFQRCKQGDWVCYSANALLKSGGTVWSDFVQGRLVPAQYFRDPNDLEGYLEHSNFLADVNNERGEKNETYRRNLAEVEKFVMVVFREDKTVVPRESGWFAEINGTEGDDGEGRVVTPLREREIYKDDWIGLRTLDEKGGLVFEEVEGEHMQLDDKDLKRLFGKYFGPMRKTKDREDL